MWAILTTTAGLALALGLIGCGHGEADGDRRVSQLREEVARVQADRDRVDQRLIALETQTAESRTAPAPRGGTPEKPLRVVRLTPGLEGKASESSLMEETASSIDDAGPRPILRVVGDPRPRRAKDRSAGRDDRIEQTLPSEEAMASAGNPSGVPSIRERAPRPSALDPEARRTYDDALALVNAKKCQQALDAFAGFLVRFPDHPNADNAMYWRGECYAQLGDLTRAIEQFEGTIARFPMGNKVPYALLKLGISYTKLGNPARAKEAWDRLEREYPQTEARRRIPRAEAGVQGRPEGKP